MYYGKNDTTTYDKFVNRAESPYHDVVGPYGKSQYITEDVPGLNVPALQLAQRASLDVPITGVVVRLASCFTVSIITPQERRLKNVASPL